LFSAGDTIGASCESIRPLLYSLYLQHLNKSLTYKEQCV